MDRLAKPGKQFQSRGRMQYPTTTEHIFCASTIEKSREKKSGVFGRNEDFETNFTLCWIRVFVCLAMVFDGVICPLASCYNCTNVCVCVYERERERESPMFTQDCLLTIWTNCFLTWDKPYASQPANILYAIRRRKNMRAVLILYAQYELLEAFVKPTMAEEQERERGRESQ